MDEQWSNDVVAMAAEWLGLEGGAELAVAQGQWGPEVVWDLLGAAVVAAQRPQRRHLGTRVRVRSGGRTRPSCNLCISTQHVFKWQAWH